MVRHAQLVPARSRGRPSLYNPEYCSRVIELAAEGCGKAEIAAALHVSPKTLTAWSKSHDEFRDALRLAKDIEYAWWLSAGRKGQFMRSWNAGGWALQMRNRFRGKFHHKGDILKSELKESANVEQIREEIEQRVARIIAAAAVESVPVEPDGDAARSPEI